MLVLPVKPELLLPAGSPDKLRYAVAYGADAVYFGLPMASLRTPGRGEQFTPANLGESIQYAQARGVKAYVTINIFPSNHDFKRIIPHLEALEQLRPDAIIFSDPGVYRVARQYAPSVPLHLSTQANTLNTQACAFWQDLGVERVILAREVPLREIAQIHEALPGLELEAFVHGSLCVAYSGRCTISDYLTDNTKNSNKGMCGNSCRWEFEEVRPEQSEPQLLSLDMRETSRPHEVYTFEEDRHGSYMLNSKDLCLVKHLRALQEAGVVSFKVEGRTKSIYYVSTVGRVYREAIDAFQTGETVSDERMTGWVAALAEAGNRGFTEGFFHGRPDQTSIQYETSKSRQTSAFLGTVERVIRDGVCFKAKNPFQVGETLEWTTPDGAVRFELTGMTDEAGFPVRDRQTNQTGVLPVPEALAHLSFETLGRSLLSRKELSQSTVGLDGKGVGIAG